MNCDELRQVLAAKGIRPRSYSLEGGSPEDRYCIEKSSGGWSVYYSERGNRNDERWFETEDDACEEFMRRVLADPSTRVRQRPASMS